MLIGIFLFAGAASAQTKWSDEIGVQPAVNAHARAAEEGRVDARGDSVFRWIHEGADAYWLQGRCRLRTPQGLVTADQVLLLVNSQRDAGGEATWNVRVAASGRLQTPAGRQSSVWQAQWLISMEPTIDAPLYRGAPQQDPELLAALVAPAAPPSAVVQAQYELVAPGDGLIESVPIPDAMVPQVRSLQPPENVVAPDVPLMPAESGGDAKPFQLIFGDQAVEINSRSAATQAVIDSQDRLDTGETVVMARGGVTVLIRDVQAEFASGELLNLGTISLSADQVVGWLPLVRGLFSGTHSLDDAEGEFYLEGNIVFRAGDRVIYADSMYYNVTRQYGMVLDAEAIASVPDFEGVVRLKADVLQQVSKGEFIAFDAAVTSSRMGVPRYWLQSEQLRFSDQTRAGIDASGRPVEIHDRVISSTNNFVYFGGVPLLYWPAFSSDVKVSSFYVNSVRLRRDSILGTQVLVDWDVF